MARFNVYLNRRYNDWSFEQVAENIAIDDQPLAVIETEDGVTLLDQLESVWQIAQHDFATNGHGWTGRREVSLCIRSMSVGDVVQAPDGRYFVVGRGGFEELASPEPCPHCGRTGGAR